jgi:tRNA(Met) cytidine acetyltransferase
LRVQRIAVHPQVQRTGIGRRLLQVAAAWASERRFDLLGCAYGVDLYLLAFWQSAGFVAVRLGVRLDPASAAHSLFMLRGLSAAGRELTLCGQQDFRNSLPWSLAASLSDLDSRLAARLLIGRDCGDLILSAADRHALDAVAAGTRQPATAEAAVWKFLVQTAAGAGETADRLAPLLAWRLQGRVSRDVCSEFSIAGRKALEGRLRALLSG